MKYWVKIRELPEWLEEMYKTGKLKKSYRFNKTLVIQKGKKINVSSFVEEIKKRRNIFRLKNKNFMINTKINGKKISVIY